MLDLKVYSMRDSILMASDGAPGIMRAVEEIFPKTLRLRCLVHNLRDL